MTEHFTPDPDQQGTVYVHKNGVVELDPADSRATICDACGRAWDDTVSTAVTPTPAGRCPFEYEHGTDDEQPVTGRRVQVHFVVPVWVTTDEAGTVIAVESPTIDLEGPGDEGRDTWDPVAEQWRGSTEAEYRAARAALRQVPDLL